jgi:hypothetical protein
MARTSTVVSVFAINDRKRKPIQYVFASLILAFWPAARELDYEFHNPVYLSDEFGGRRFVSLQIPSHS